MSQIERARTQTYIARTVTIKAIAGFVELSFAAIDPSGGGAMNLHIPCAAIAEFVKSLEIARDAAAQMASTQVVKGATND